MDLRELALPGGFLMLLLSAAAQLPFFIFLCNYLDGDASVGMKVGCLGDMWQRWQKPPAKLHKYGSPGSS